jgi:hypothetical protein
MTKRTRSRNTRRPSTGKKQRGNATPVCLMESSSTTLVGCRLPTAVENIETAIEQQQNENYPKEPVNDQERNITIVDLCLANRKAELATTRLAKETDCEAERDEPNLLNLTRLSRVVEDGGARVKDVVAAGWSGVKDIVDRKLADYERADQARQGIMRAQVAEICAREAFPSFAFGIQGGHDRG